MRRKFFLFLCFLFLYMVAAPSYFANLTYITGQADAISNVAGKAECVMEANSRRILYQNNGDMRLPMASTTKIVTAATILDICDDIKNEVKIPQQAVGIEGSSIYLKADESYTIEELLYGLMLRSGNDAATALALQFGGTMRNFSAKMNLYAQKAGALNSNFKNPHGLPCYGHYTTAVDLCYITCAAMENATFRQIVSTQYYTPKNWANKNKLLRLYKGGIGVKTGYTLEAGRCLVAAAERNGMTLICTLLSCPTTYERTIKLFDDAFSAYQNTSILQKGDIFSLPFENEYIACYIEDNFSYPIIAEESAYLRTKMIAIENANEKKSGEIVGQIEIYLTKRLLFSGNLYKL